MFYFFLLCKSTKKLIYTKLFHHNYLYTRVNFDVYYILNSASLLEFLYLCSRKGNGR